MQMSRRRVKIYVAKQFTTISKIDVSIALHCSAMSISLLSVEWSHSHACALLGLGPFGVKQFNVPSDAHVKTCDSSCCFQQSHLSRFLIFAFRLWSTRADFWCAHNDALKMGKLKVLQLPQQLEGPHPSYGQG